jgi:hypothetical protein
MCCADGYCDPNELCCEDTGCFPATGAECCLDGGYCPDPFICVQELSTGNIGCCTDLDCTVYLDADTGATVTYTYQDTATTYTDYDTSYTTYTTDTYTFDREWVWYTTTLYW